MGFLDKAKNKLKQTIGEETVRVVDYDDAPAATRPKAVSRPKAEEPDSWAEEAPAFEVEGDDYFAKQQRDYEKSLQRFDGVPDLPADPAAGTISDVLQVLEIPETFELERNVLAPEDIDEVVFDQQIPQGFDMGQVTAFLEQVRMTTQRYITLLQLRNEHVAKLATVIDKLQLDANTLKYQNEIANGINIMPTHDNDEFETQNSELRLLVSSLTAELEELRGSGLVAPGALADASDYSALQDQYSLLQREHERALDELQEARSRLAYLEETSDDEDENATLIYPDEHANLVDELPAFEPAFQPADPVPHLESSAFLDADDDFIPAPATPAPAAAAHYVTPAPPMFEEAAHGGFVTYDEDTDEDAEALEAMMKDWNRNA